MDLRVGAGSASLVAAPVVVGSSAAADLQVAGLAPEHACFALLPDGRVELRVLAGPVTVDGEPVAGLVTIGGDERVVLGDVVVALDAPGAAVQPTLDALAEPAAAAGDVEPGAVELPHIAPPRRRIRRSTKIATGALAVAVVALTVGLAALGGRAADPSGRDEADVAAIVAGAKRSVVLVRAQAGGQGGSGSGWVLDAGRGLVITNHHVVAGASELDVRVGDQDRGARVLAAAPCDDLAVLEVDDAEGLRALPLADRESVRQGDVVVAVGYPANAGGADTLSATAGVVSVVSAPLRSPTPDSPSFPDMLQTDAAINPGNSGGPLLDRRGRLVGVNTAVLTEIGGVPIQGQGYAIGVEQVRRVAADLREGRSRGWTGADLAAADPRQLARNDLPRGLLAVAAAPDTEASRAGLGERPVLVTAVDGTKLDGTIPSYCRAVADSQSGQATTFDVVAGPGGRTERVRLAFE